MFSFADIVLHKESCDLTLYIIPKDMGNHQRLLPCQVK